MNYRIMKCFFIISLLLVVAACQPANITAVKWNTDTTVAQTRCERVDIRNKTSMENVFSKYDGWKMIYISEYTTDKMFSTDSVVCFERLKP